MTVNVDDLDRRELAADFGSSFGVGVILANPDLLLLAYRSQGYTNARIDPATGRVIPGENDGSEMDANAILVELPNTKWYQTYDGNQRQAQLDRESDPATWARKVGWAEAALRRQAVQFGADLTGVNVRAEAERMLVDNYGQMPSGADATLPDSVVNAYLAPFITRTPQGNFSGEAAISAESLRQKAEAYGVTLSDQWYANAVQQLRAGSITEADLDNEIIENAKSRYPSMAGTISASRTVKSLADPYIQLMSEVLEMNPATITLQNPDIQRALQVVDPGSGQVRSKSLWEFQQELRQKPEWTSTTRGRQEMNTAAMQMLKDFGFVE